MDFITCVKIIRDVFGDDQQDVKSQLDRLCCIAIDSLALGPDALNHFRGKWVSALSQNSAQDQERIKAVAVFINVFRESHGAEPIIPFDMLRADNGEVV